MNKKEILSRREFISTVSFAYLASFCPEARANPLLLFFGRSVLLRAIKFVGGDLLGSWIVSEVQDRIFPETKGTRESEYVRLFFDLVSALLFTCAKCKKNILLKELGKFRWQIAGTTAVRAMQCTYRNCGHKGTLTVDTELAVRLLANTPIIPTPKFEPGSVYPHSCTVTPNAEPTKSNMPILNVGDAIFRGWGPIPVFQKASSERSKPKRIGQLEQGDQAAFLALKSMRINTRREVEKSFKKLEKQRKKDWEEYRRRTPSAAEKAAFPTRNERYFPKPSPIPTQSPISEFSRSIVFAHPKSLFDNDRPVFTGPQGWYTKAGNCIIAESQLGNTYRKCPISIPNC